MSLSLPVTKVSWRKWWAITITATRDERGRAACFPFGKATKGAAANQRSQKPEQEKQELLSISRNSKEGGEERAKAAVVQEWWLLAMEFLGLVGEEVAEAPNVRIGSRKPTGIAFPLIDSSSERLREFCSCTGGAQGPGDKIKILQPQKSGNCSCRLQMEEDSGILGSHHRPAPHRSRLRLPSCAGGDAAAVQGAARSTARKDRHSKVSTAKGPRDRRLRLSALTAIQFYDVQDRLGFDRPSKAVDWLILNAKHAIDQLATSPAPPPAAPPPSSFLPPSLDSDAVAYTIKSFFPTFDDPQMLTRSNLSQDQDLRLSLQSFQDPGLGFNTGMAGWAEQSQRMAECNAVETVFPFNVPPPHAVLLFSQREPLQSMNSPLARGWVPAGSVPPQAELQMCPMFELEPGSTGFHIPARFGGEEERGEVSDKPPSASASRR